MTLNHIAIIISKEDHLSFYKELGFKETNRFERAYDTVVLMENNGIGLEVFIDPKHPERQTNPEQNGLRHIAFTVEDFDEITKTIDCEPVRINWFGQRFTFTKDPDGQPIEFVEKKEERY